MVGQGRERHTSTRRDIDSFLEGLAGACRGGYGIDMRGARGLGAVVDGVASQQARAQRKRWQKGGEQLNQRQEYKIYDLRNLQNLLYEEFVHLFMRLYETGSIL